MVDSNFIAFQVPSLQHLAIIAINARLMPNHTEDRNNYCHCYGEIYEKWFVPSHIKHKIAKLPIPNGMKLKMHNMYNIMNRDLNRWFARNKNLYYLKLPRIHRIIWSPYGKVDDVATFHATHNTLSPISKFIQASILCQEDFIRNNFKEEQYNQHIQGKITGNSRFTLKQTKFLTYWKRVHANIVISENYYDMFEISLLYSYFYAIRYFWLKLKPDEKNYAFYKFAKFPGLYNYHKLDYAQSAIFLFQNMSPETQKRVVIRHNEFFLYIMSDWPIIDNYMNVVTHFYLNKLISNYEFIKLAWCLVYRRYINVGEMFCYTWTLFDFEAYNNCITSCNIIHPSLCKTILQLIYYFFSENKTDCLKVMGTSSLVQSLQISLVNALIGTFSNAYKFANEEQLSILCRQLRLDDNEVAKLKLFYKQRYDSSLPPFAFDRTTNAWTDWVTQFWCRPGTDDKFNVLFVRNMTYGL